MSQANTEQNWATQGSPCGCYAINVAQPINFCPKHGAVDALVDALQNLALLVSRIAPPPYGHKMPVVRRVYSKGQSVRPRRSLSYSARGNEIMKTSEARKYVSATTVDDAEVRLERLITDEEFRVTPDKGDYRKRVVDRLVALRVPFSSDENTLQPVAKYLKADCPYCTSKMSCAYDGGASAGGFGWACLKFICEQCKSTIGVTLPPSAISFQPEPEEGTK